MLFRQTILSPVGHMLIEAGELGIQSIRFINFYNENDNSNPDTLSAAKQLHLYFRGELETFDLKLQIEGTDFQKRIWEIVSRIPKGQTRSYRSIAMEIGNQKVVKAVRRAVLRNPFAIVIPSHRILGTNGNVTGYAGGLARKQWLLSFERADCFHQS